MDSSPALTAPAVVQQPPVNATEIPCERNRAFASQRFTPSRSLMPTLRTVVVGRGITRLVGFCDLLAGELGVAPEDPPARAINDPWAAVAQDVAILRSLSGLPPGTLVSGFVYDVETGLLASVAAPAPGLRSYPAGKEAANRASVLPTTSGWSSWKWL